MKTLPQNKFRLISHLLLKKSADIYTTPKVKLWPGYFKHQNDGRADRQQRQKKNCEFSHTGNIPSTLL